MLRFINAGEVFNEIAALAGKPNPATAIALEESGLWLIPRGALEEIILAHPRIALQIIANMADKIIGLVTLAVVLLLIPSVPGWAGDPERDSLVYVSIPISMQFWPLISRTWWASPLILSTSTRLKGFSARSRPITRK